MTEYRYEYNSALRDYFYAFIDHKVSKNHDEFSYAFLFKGLDAFLIDRNYDKRYIDEPIYKDWLAFRNERVCQVTIAREVSMMRMFLIFTTKLGNECYIPAPMIAPKKSYVPHIFSEEELTSLFAAADGLRLKNRYTHNCVHMMPALFRLLYSTGMRIGEALEIRNRDIDMKARVIKLRKTKNGRERLSPINDSLASVLEEYIVNRNKIPFAGINAPDGYFFCGTRGQKAQHTTVRTWFHAARMDAGIPYYGRSSGPNVHCLRHTACVHSLLKMVRSGKDPYCCLPMLATFMGHRDVADTEYYLHLSEELYPEIVRLDRNISSGINSVLKNAVTLYAYENK